MAKKVIEKIGVTDGELGGFLEAYATDVATNTGGLTVIATLTLTPGRWLVSATSYTRASATQTGAIHALYIKGANTGASNAKDYGNIQVSATTASCMPFATRIVEILSGDANKTIQVQQQSLTAAGLGGAHITAVRLPYGV